MADSEGHPRGVNRVVPLTFPKLRRKFGDVVTYEQDPKAHLRVEFGKETTDVQATFTFRNTCADAPVMQLVGFPDMAAAEAEQLREGGS